MEPQRVNLTEFIISECEHIRQAYDDRVNQTRLLERYALLATGLIWSWCATHMDSPAIQFLKWMPMVITFLLGLRAWGNAKAIFTTRDYLVRIEKQIDLPEGFGWGNYLKHNQESRLMLSAYLFWAILQALTIIIPIVYG